MSARSPRTLTTLLLASLLAVSVATARPQMAQKGGHEGTVLETMNAGGYTYVRVETDDGEIWVAGPNSPVAVGDRVALGAGSTMTNFHSESLDRTFDSILFVGAIRVVSSAGGESSEATLARAHAAEVKPGAAGVAPVAKATDGWTIAELYAGKTELSGKPVAVRGRVVKFNDGILGRNWIHIQDGTGTDGTHDLTVTTDAVAAVGDIVLVNGTVATDRDFGMGYKYDLIVEEAQITVE